MSRIGQEPTRKKATPAEWAAVSRILHHHVETIVGGRNHGKPDLVGLQAKLLGRQGLK